MSEHHVPEFLIELERWILWREVIRAGKPTKVPISVRGGTATDVTDPRNWGSHDFCVAARVRSPGAWDGEGIVLGELDRGEDLAGLDLDSCIEAGELAPWAAAYLNTLDTYAEISPSGQGMKLFFRVPHADLPAIRALFDIPATMFGRRKTYSNGHDGAHPPGAELYLSHRFFTVTGRAWAGGSDNVALIGLETMRQLAALFGPREASIAGSDELGDATPPAPEELRAKLAAAMRDRMGFAERWMGITTGLADASRSGFDMSLGAMLKGAGFSYGEMRAALIANPHGAGAERSTDDERYFERIWTRSVVTAKPPMPEPPPGISDGPAPHEQTSETKTTGDSKPVLELAYGFEALEPKPLGTIVEGLLHAGSLTLVYGPPKSGKSFLVTDLALAITDVTRDEWMGHDIVRHGPMLYVACEGHAGFWKRLTAAANARGWDRDAFPKGFILATGRPMLIRAETRGLTYAPDPSSIIEAIQDAKARDLEPVGIVIDTVFRSFGAGNVNASPDMNVYLAAVAVLTDQGYAAALVHHEIKAGGTPAGSVSLIGGADNMVHVWPENESREQRFWQVEMAKDDAETEPRAFTLEVVPVGLDPEGRPVSSCIVHDAGASQQAAKKRGRPTSGNSEGAILAALILDELYNLMADPREGEDVSMHPESPPIRAVARGRLRAAIKKAGILDAEDGNGNEKDRRRDVKANNLKIQRAISMLKKQGKIICDDVWVGLR